MEWVMHDMAFSMASRLHIYKQCMTQITNVDHNRWAMVTERTSPLSACSRRALSPLRLKLSPLPTSLTISASGHWWRRKATCRLRSAFWPAKETWHLVTVHVQILGLDLGLGR